MTKQRTRAIILALVLTLATALTCVTPVYAASVGQKTGSGMIITPKYTYAHSVTTELSITGTTASVYVGLKGNSMIKSISVTYSLQKKSGTSWQSVKSWTASKSAAYIDCSNTYSPLTKGAQYRVYATFKVTGTDGKTETITDYTSTYTC